MTEATNVRLVAGGISEYQTQYGLRRVYPSNGVPKIQKRKLSEEEREIISAPLIKHAREQKAS